jgi:hypothetical protein
MDVYIVVIGVNNGLDIDTRRFCIYLYCRLVAVRGYVYRLRQITVPCVY